MRLGTSPSVGEERRKSGEEEERGNAGSRGQEPFDGEDLPKL